MDIFIATCRTNDWARIRELLDARMDTNDIKAELGGMSMVQYALVNYTPLRIPGSSMDIFMTACRTNDWARVVEPLDAKMDINGNKVELGGMTMLHYAIMSNAPNIVTLLIQHGADIAAPDVLRRTPLHYAAYGVKGIEYIIPLLAAGADVNAKNHDGNTPLHVCLNTPSGMEKATILIAAGANINAQNDIGDTVLHVMVYHRDRLEHMCRFLDAGARTDIRNEEGYTPAELCRDEATITALGAHREVKNAAHRK